MRRQPKQLELPYSIERDFIGYLKDEVIFWRGEYNFLKGKVERLELAAFTHGNQVAKEYVQRSDAKPIEATPVEQKPAQKTWKQVQQEWNNLTPEQQEEALAKGAN